MRTPAWWYGNGGLRARLLAPLGLVYGQVTAGRLARGAPYRAGVPVICVGNLDAGGSGKTPVVIALAQRLGARGVEVHVVSRGHGGRLAGPVRVTPSHRAEEVGDEPLLLSAFAPAWVAKDRAAGVQAAEAAGAGAILLDDGFQNPSVAKDLSLVVVDAARGWGNGRAIPAGPLRETVQAGLARADLVVSVGDSAAQEAFTARWGAALRGAPHLRGELRPLPTGMPWQGIRALAFAGIGQPEKFFATLRSLGTDVVATQALDDHQPFTRPLLQRLEADGKRLVAQLVTTEKDAVRLPPEMRTRVLTLPVRLHLDDWGPVDAALDRVLGQSQGESRQP
ncbi:Tetraacyldisaccharide 4'-kinase [Rubellimicrobium mesophilum DSM 19309]|uniref:Tetraacyldisaccharide 4'-kinase n=1 Tax=Rubellimicrobium mesophilum DSM 19309 TaxID=442562 RepID=A0A017HKJ7_9RHOB|nr:tetraacyldisaccharide 4'-kinase [Rubellimicrobium mesophilum]EYD74678.1 Tetraacyldisaccharide 4'-kinase [Rubellimicrobium mesophilum DSM 19309]